MAEERIVRLVVDVKQRRPACVILQAIYGGDRSIVSRYFDCATWLLAPTDDMRMVTGSLSEWRRFADEVNAEIAASKLDANLAAMAKEHSEGRVGDVSILPSPTIQNEAA